MNQSRYTSIVVGILLGFIGVAAAEPSLTIYNQDFAVVRRPLAFDLTAGINEVRVTDITEKSDPFTKIDSQTIEFRVQVPAGQEKIVTYKVRYAW